MNANLTISKQIKEYAASISFDACGICRAEKIDEAEQQHILKWLEDGYQSQMEYLSRNTDKRVDPTLLIEGAKSIISLALNYYPEQKQSSEAPQFAYYAYGKDYHDIMKDKLYELLSYIKTILPNCNGRAFVDTAPIMERYWAAKSGIGFIGKNTLLIIPQKGSFFFLGEIVIDAELDYYDKPLNLSCGNCTRCLDACPTKAIEMPHLVNSDKCISYQTIENKGEIDLDIVPLLGNKLYGCDICQQVCPWNRFASPHITKEFTPNKEFISLDYESIEKMSQEDYQRIFKGSAVKRAKYTGLMRNFEAIKKPRKD
ncbi:tRNA epoxyqueuosine(34) reductase QueG [Dysgonomonas sp. OttesenSCG-928-M03]|nr:tRNA epoxyqueuosine(34) reductase QueG [Dysgonomonas sp. OttesenSCG-928-M03]